MSLIVISIDRDKLPKHTQEEFENWVKLRIGQIGSLSGDNPMADMDLYDVDGNMLREASR